MSPRPQGELGRVVRAIVRGWWIILICAIIAVAAGVGASTRIKSNYRSTAYVLLNTAQFQQAVTGSAPQIDSQTQEATAIAMLTPLRQARAAQAAGLDPNDTYGVSVGTASNSNVLNVTGTTSSAHTAAALANAAAAQLIAAVKSANQDALKGARSAVQSQLAAAKRPDKRALANQLNSFSTLEALSDQNIQIIQHAFPPVAASGLSKAKVGGIALVLGVILGIAVALLRRERPRIERL